MKKLDNVGNTLDIFCLNTPKLIKSICEKSLEMFTQFKELTEYYLSFLDENELVNTEIVQKTLKIYQKFFLKK